MALGTVQINRLNLMQGPFTEYEGFLIFIGEGKGVNEGQLLMVNSESDLDVLLGETESNLKTQVLYAQMNAGQNWNAAVLPMADGTSWSDGADYAMTQTNAEGIIITDPVTTSTDIENMQAKSESIMAMYMRPLWFGACVAGCDNDPSAGQTWSEYSATIKPIITGLACDNVLVVPQLFGYDLGALAGRLCDNSVTVADTPMRVATGSLVGQWSELPTDKNGLELDMATLNSLDTGRFSVVQWYPDYPGVYFGDGNVLDVPGGDYQVIENVRVVQKAMRRVYPLAVARIGDRKLNSTPASIASNKTYFMRPLREMSITSEILGTVFPGEIHPPKDNSIEIVWTTKTSVEIYLTVQPYNCPKAITVNIALDLTNYAA